MPILNQQPDRAFKNVDEISLTSNLEEMINCYQTAIPGNQRFTIKKRFGSKKFVDLGTNRKVDGLFWSEKNQVVFAVSGQKVFKITNQNGAFTDITGAEAPNSSVPVTWAEVLDGANILTFMATGGRIVYTDGTTTQYIADPDAPTDVTHIASIDTFLIANLRGEPTFQRSNPNAPLTWDPADSQDAEFTPSDIIALFVNSGKIYVFKRDSIETYYNSGTPGAPFTRINSSSIENGINSPYSIIKADIGGTNILTFIDSMRRAIAIQGSEHVVLSGDYNRYLQDLDRIEDGIATSISIDGQAFYIVNFFDAKKTIAYNFTSKSWSDFGVFNEADGDYDSYFSNCSTYAKKWNKRLVGDNKTGIIWEVDNSFLTDDGNKIRSKFITGQLNAGSDELIKKSNGLTVRVKRGIGKEGDKYEKPFMLIRYKDNGVNVWKNWIKVDLGAVGDTFSSLSPYRTGGTFSSRKFEVIMPDESDFILAGMSEDVDIIRKGSSL